MKGERGKKKKEETRRKIYLPPLNCSNKYLLKNGYFCILQRLRGIEMSNFLNTGLLGWLDAPGWQGDVVSCTVALPRRHGSLCPRPISLLIKAFQSFKIFVRSSRFYSHCYAYYRYAVSITFALFIRKASTIKQIVCVHRCDFRGALRCQNEKQRIFFLALLCIFYENFNL